MDHIKNYKLFENFKQSVPFVNLPRTNLNVPKLCFGTNPLSRFKLTYEEGGNILKYAYNKGLNFWDTSDDYETHLHIREAKKDLPKKDIIILSKITNVFEKNKVQNHINNMLYELNNDEIDILLLHAVDSLEEYYNYMNILEEIKNSPVKHIGASSHNPEIISKLAEESDIEIIMAPINYKGEINIDYKIDDNIKYRDNMIDSVKKCKDNNKDIIAIKIFGKGFIEDKDRAIKFISRQDYVDVIDLGMENIEQINQNIELINKYFNI